MAKAPLHSRMFPSNSNQTLQVCLKQKFDNVNIRDDSE